MHKLLSNISLIIALIISLNSIGQVNDTTLIKVISDSNNYESIIPDSLSTSPTIHNSNNVFDRTFADSIPYNDFSLDTSFNDTSLNFLAENTDSIKEENKML